MKYTVMCLSVYNFEKHIYIHVFIYICMYYVHVYEFLIVNLFKYKNNVLFINIT